MSGLLRLSRALGFVFLILPHFFAFSQSSASSSISKVALNAEFNGFYKKELGSTQPCTNQARGEYKACSNVLKNEGNAPYILHALQPKAVVVLFHGLSDSPFYVRSIAEHLQGQNITVVAPLLPGHGKRAADADMEDPRLQQRWHAHVQEVMSWSEQMNLPTFVGGFSTGGALATYYALDNSELVEGLLLFSGALQLADNAESMAKVWGIKWLAKIVDGDYQTSGPSPFKYPVVSGYSALVLADVIFDIRDILTQSQEQGTPINMPVFAAHSGADNVTLYSGIESLVKQVEGEHSVFKIDESYDLCHADLPVNSIQIVAMKFNKSLVKEHEKCAVPIANPLHQKMLSMMMYFVEQRLSTEQ